MSTITRSQRNRAGAPSGPPASSNVNYSIPPTALAPSPYPPPLPPPPLHLEQTMEAATSPLREPSLMEPLPAEASILSQLSEDSALAIILKSNSHFMVHDPGTNELDFPTELLIMKSLDDIIESVPNSVITLYTHLIVAATYERLGRDIPLDVQYTAIPDGQDYPYNAQATAYGIDKILDKASQLGNGRLPLLNHTKFKSNTYLSIQNRLQKKENHMARLFLGNLLQTYLRNCEYLTQSKPKKGPRNQTYAAISQQRLPLQRQPRKILFIRPIQNARYPCARCIATATILTTTEKKYTEELTIRIRNRTLDEYEKYLPSSLRKRFRDIYNTLTEGIPNHTESDGCPLSAQQEKRAAFHQAAPSKMSPEQANGLNSAIVTACKQHNLCAKCGRTRTPATERFHRTCRADPRAYPPRKEPDFINKCCRHPLHPQPSLWRSHEYTSKCRYSDIGTYSHLFVKGIRT